MRIYVNIKGASVPRATCSKNPESIYGHKLYKFLLLTQFPSLPSWKLLTSSPSGAHELAFPPNEERVLSCSSLCFKPHIESIRILAQVFLSLKGAGEGSSIGSEINFSFSREKTLWIHDSSVVEESETFSLSWFFYSLLDEGWSRLANLDVIGVVLPVMWAWRGWIMSYSKLFWWWEFA
jgi:hypothetical protein